MLRLDYLSLRATPVATDPFPHVVVPHFVPQAELRHVLADLPPVSDGGLFPVTSLRLGTRVQELAAALQGPHLRNSIAVKFGIDLDGAPTMLTLRGYSRRKDGRIHIDAESKRVTALLYLNLPQDSWLRHEGCLRLLRGPRDIEDYVVEVPPVDGTLLIFVNSTNAWHGYRGYVGSRYALQLQYMTHRTVARSELRRHAVSAFFKRLRRPAAGTAQLSPG